MLEFLAMPKPKSDSQDSPNRKVIAVTIKGSDEWKAWLEEGAAHCNHSVSSLVDHAVRAFFKKNGFDKAGPKR